VKMGAGQCPNFMRPISHPLLGDKMGVTPVEHDVKDCLLRILSLMKVQAAFLSDSLTRIEAIRQRLADQGSLDYTEYTRLLERATQQGDATLPLAQIREIDEMIQSISDDRTNGETVH
jgi:hypothetical protein